MFALLDFCRSMTKCFKILPFHPIICQRNRLLSTEILTRNTFKKYENVSYFHTSFVLSIPEDGTTKVKADKNVNNKPAKKKKEKLTYITLVETNNNITVTTLEDANKLATRRNLKLFKIKDYEAKSDRPTYQLMTTAQYLSEEKTLKDVTQNKSLRQGIKLVSISSKINEHDLNPKIKSIIKWLQKRNEVKVVISNDNGEAENVYDAISSRIMEFGKPVQKRSKGFEIRFQIVPLKIKSPATIKEEDVIT